MECPRCFRDVNPVTLLELDERDFLNDPEGIVCNFCWEERHGYGRGHRQSYKSTNEYEGEG